MSTEKSQTVMEVNLAWCTYIYVCMYGRRQSIQFIGSKKKKKKDKNGSSNPPVEMLALFPHQ